MSFRLRPILPVAFAFSLALGAGTVTIPLLALGSGYDAATVGFLAAVAAASQFATRLALPPLFGRFSDRMLIGAASLLMAAVFALLLGSSALPVFVVAQLLQGVARAVFWTSCQTHVVHGSGRPVRALVDLTLAGNAGTLLGPVVAGLLAVDGFGRPLALAVVAALAAAAAVTVLEGHRPMDRRGGVGSLAILGRPGQLRAAWSSATGGVWWSMLGSFVPVLLVDRGFGPGAIGASITASEAAGAIGLAAVRRLHVDRAGALVLILGGCTVVALVVLALGPADWPASLGVLMVGGAASGAITALAPAVASAAAAPREQGDALAISGAFRAGAMLVAPASVGALLLALPLTGALAAFGAALLVPTAIVATLRPPRPARMT